MVPGSKTAGTEPGVRAARAHHHLTVSLQRVGHVCNEPNVIARQARLARQLDSNLDKGLSIWDSKSWQVAGAGDVNRYCAQAHPS